MFWRAATLLVVIFWIVMTMLLVRVTYFSGGAFFTEVPPRVVLKSFLDQAATPNGLHVYHGERKAGHASCTSLQRRGAGGGVDYLLVISGRLEDGAIKSVEGIVTWDLKITLLDARLWAGASGNIRIPSRNLVVNFQWLPAQRIPQFTVEQDGVIVTDDTAIQPVIAQMLGGSPEGTASGASAGDIFAVNTREGSLKVAGQKRHGYLLTLGMTDKFQIKAFFTEIGEVALVELPDGWRALEPMIHGLVPDEEPET
jgi:hypothetical protein